MRIILLILLIVLSVNGQTQSINFFDKVVIDEKRPTIIYTIASWCRQNKSDYEQIKDTLIIFREKYDLILLIDTIKTNLFDYQEVVRELNPDKIIVLTDVFPQRLQKLQENKKYTKMVNDYFQLNLFRLGPASMILIRNKIAIPILFDQRSTLIVKNLLK
jgi:hypothetical protein